jgi:hyperosmotically inducible protein
MKTKLSIAMLVAGLAAVGLAHAQTAERFKSLDRNSDGFISQGETAHLEGYAAALKQADDNRDGKLSADEFTKAEAIHDRQQIGKYVDDSVLTAKVKTALLREKGLNSMDVSVESHRGRVLLSVFVEDQQQRKQALAVASNVGGVVSVKDGMTVR